MNLLLALLQTLSITLHAMWTPNPPLENVVQYVMTIDGGSNIIIPASSCTPSLCSQTFSVPTFGHHVITLRAQNLLISTLQNSLQDGPVTTFAYTLGATPTVVGAITIGG